MKNKFACLGFLGLLGFLGFLCSSPILFSFFANFVFFTYARIVPDELFWENVKQAGLVGFLTEMTLSSTVIACGLVMQDWGVGNPASFLIGGLAITLTISELLFLLVLSYREYKEKREPVGE